jgi:hypothetical protein
MEEHVQNLMAKFPRVDTLQYALDTLEIERGRLNEAVRAMRALPVSGDDYPEERVKEQTAAWGHIERAIFFLRQAIETRESEDRIQSEQSQKLYEETDQRWREREKREREERRAKSQPGDENDQSRPSEP